MSGYVFFLFCEVYNMKLFRYTVCIELRVVMEKGMKMNVKGVTYGPGPMFANKTRVWKQGLTWNKHILNWAYKGKYYQPYYHSAWQWSGFKHGRLRCVIETYQLV